MAIIKYNTSFIGTTNATYENVVTPKKLGKIISKEEAKKVIRRDGLIMVYQDENGAIWDTPDKQFYETYKGMAKEIKEI